MGARLYNSVTGLFTSRDPVDGGNSTSYVYPQDPVGMQDTAGTWGWAKKAWKWGVRAWHSPGGRVARRVVSVASWFVPGGAALKVGIGVYKGYKLYKAVKSGKKAWGMTSGRGRYSKFSQGVAGRMWVGRGATKHKGGEWRSKNLTRSYRPASKKRDKRRHAANYQSWKSPRKSNSNNQFRGAGDYNFHSHWNKRRW